ncbi:hypothetical protein BCR36DRAFT_588472, partial [Piromyces finnis]
NKNNDDDYNAQRKSVRERLQEKIGFLSKRYILYKTLYSIGWLYAARGFYKLEDYHSVIECITPALRNERTKRERNDTDWQPFVELLIDNPKLKLS